MAATDAQPTRPGGGSAGCETCCGLVSDPWQGAVSTDGMDFVGLLYMLPSRTGACLDLATKSTLTPLAGLSSLQCLRLSLSSWRLPADGWGWLQKLLRLTCLHLSSPGTLRFVLAASDCIMQCGHTLVGLSVCAGLLSPIFDFEALGHLTMLEEASIRCAAAAVTHRHAWICLLSLVVHTYHA
jgi:hypothetical protein